MDRIIAGRFQTKDEADSAALNLLQVVDTTDIYIFHNNPPGQHDKFAVGGDEAVDPGADGAGKAALVAAVATGLAGGAIGALAGPAGAIAGAATGAYVGSLGGALNALGNDENQQGSRLGGIILSVHIANTQNEGRVIEILQAAGTEDIEQADGEWRDGKWADFDPVAVPRLIQANGNARHA